MNQRMKLVFEHVATHLLTQNAKAQVKGGEATKYYEDDEEEANMTCVYRSPDGLRCAIGSIILDSVYDPTLEGKTIVSMEVQEAVEKSVGFGLDTDDIQLLDVLQYIHDSIGVEAWPTKLDKIRKELLS